MKTSLIILSLLYIVSVVSGQNENDKYAKDVKSIDSIIKAYYDVFSGSKDDPWQFERDKYLHAPDAMITRIDEDGIATSHSLEAEYVTVLSVPREDFYEIELHRIVNTYGNLAQIWSTFEIRTNPKVPSSLRGVNSIELYFSEGRWWIASWMTQMENENKLPPKYLGGD